MRKAIRVSALVLLLACSTRAGIMPNGTPEPPPAPPPTQEAADGGDITNPPLVALALSLLALF